MDPVKILGALTAPEKGNRLQSGVFIPAIAAAIRRHGFRLGIVDF